MRFLSGYAAGAAVLLAGCGGSETVQPREFRAELDRVGPANARAHLTGDEEVPPTGSAAQGQAIFRLSPDGSSMSFRVLVANINNTLMAHIHVAPPGVNGPIVVWLRPSGPPPVLVPGRFDGVYAEGTFTAANLVGPLAGQPLQALIDAMEAGSTYTNVHTSQHPGGEIRGQISGTFH